MKNNRLHYISIPVAILCLCLLFCILAGPGILNKNTGVLAADETPATGTTTPTVTTTASPIVTATPTVSATPSVTASPSPTAKVSPTPFATPTPSPTPTPEPDGPSEGAQIVDITAFYSGEHVLVGEEFDLDQLVVGHAVARRDGGNAAKGH